MKCIILAAGYATRLYPLTKNYPKPLLEIGSYNILERLIFNLDQTKMIESYFIITNSRFKDCFVEWARSHMGEYPIRIFADPSTDNENRCGAVVDLDIALYRMNSVNDVFVAAGDNLLDFSLKDFLEFAEASDSSCVMRYYEPDLKKLRKKGVAEIDSEGMIVNMEEKPQRPKSHWTIPPFYYLKKHDLPKVREALSEGCESDAPGSFIAWLCKRSKIRTFEMNGNRYDVGDLESYEKLRWSFDEILRNKQQ